MRLPIYLYGHPVLRAVAAPIDVQAPDPTLKELIENMYETMYSSDGVGLAAPQIGKSIALVVIDGQPLAERFPECEGFKRTIINPELEILDGDEVGRDEGCPQPPRPFRRGEASGAYPPPLSRRRSPAPRGGDLGLCRPHCAA